MKHIENLKFSGKMPYKEQDEITIDDCLTLEDISYFNLLYIFNFKKRTDYNQFQKCKFDDVYFVFSTKDYYININRYNINQFKILSYSSYKYSLVVNYSSDYKRLNFKLNGHDIHIENQSLKEINDFLNNFLKLKLRYNKIKCLCF